MPEHNLKSIAFAVFGEEQIAQVADCTTVAPKLYRDGETPIKGGERCLKFYIVKSGSIEILDVSGDELKPITIHEKGEFTGDISHLTGTPAIFSVAARGDAEVFEITGEALRHVMNQCPSLGDIIPQAFLARRQLLRESR
jgi:thioredoxin reductase (NADPH)